MRSSDSKRKTWLLYALGLSAVFLFLTFDLVTMRRIFKWDAFYLYWPMFYDLASSLQAGHLPLWTPLACCGFPLFAEPQSGSFYPVLMGLGYLFGGGYKVYQAYWLLHWFWGLLGFFFLAKAIGVSPIGSFVGAILFGFNGFFVGHGQHTVWIVSAAFVPWTLLLLTRAVDEKIAYSLPAGLLLGFSALGGHPGLTVYSGLMAAVWCAAKGGLRPRVALVLAIAGLTASIVSSPSMVSFLVENSGYADRASAMSVREVFNFNPFPFDALISTLVPGVTVKFPNLFHITPDKIPILNAYMGILGVLSLALVIVTKNLRERWIWLLVFMLAAFLLSLGSNGGLGVLAYYLFPPLQYVRNPCQFRFFWMLGGAMLAAWLFDQFARGDDEEIRELTAPSVKLLLVALFLTMCTATWAWIGSDSAIITEPRFVTSRFQANSLSHVFSVVVPQCVLIGLFAAALLLFRTSVRRSIAVFLLVCLVVLDAATHLQINKYTLSWNGDAGRVASEMEDKGARAKTLRDRDHNLIVKRLGEPNEFSKWAFDGKSYVRTYLAPTSTSYERLVGNTWGPYETTRFLSVLVDSPRCWLVPKVSLCPDRDKKALSILRNAQANGPVPVFVHDGAGSECSSTEDAITPGSYGSVEILTYAPQEVVLKVDAPADCWLFCTERYAASWKGYIDEEPTQLWKANFCFRAVQVPQGPHIVKMRYAPWIYKPLLAASWLVSIFAIVVWGGLGASACFRPRENRAPLR